MDLTTLSANKLIAETMKADTAYSASIDALIAAGMGRENQTDAARRAKEGNALCITSEAARLRCVALNAEASRRRWYHGTLAPIKATA